MRGRIPKYETRAHFSRDRRSHSDRSRAEPDDLLGRVAAERTRGARPRHQKAQCVGHVHADAGTSRRRDQRAVRAVHTRYGAAIDRRTEQPRRRRSERDRPRALPRPRRAAHLRATVGASHRRRGAVLHARDRLRLLVRSRGSDQQVGARRNHWRLRSPDPHAAARRRRHDEHPGARRRPRA